MPLMGYRHNERIAAQSKLEQLGSLGLGTAWAFYNSFFFFRSLLANGILLVLQ